MMSVILGKGVLLNVMESHLKCPVCEGHFDASDKIEKAKDPFFKTKCPNCKVIQDYWLKQDPNYWIHRRDNFYHYRF